MTYKTTGIWRRAKAQAEAQNVYPQWQRLEGAYDRFWEKATRISGLISQELPGLTLHDENHLLAVWKTADLIAGDDYEMTPLEVFVFGGAVLLHDLGHTVTVYESGMDAIKRTDEWRDAVLWRLDLADDDPTPPDEVFADPGAEIEQAALFDTLRALHAEQAEKLCEQSYDGPFGEIHLLDDAELRPHLAQIIGRIAASHHWDREDLRRDLGGTKGAVGATPDLGTIQPVKLACLLRCADACQIDQRRAPDIDYALHQPEGYSRLHWDAQNRLSTPFAEGGSIAFTSTRAFEESDADAWWIAHDLVQVAHQELQECDALMTDQGLPPFAMKGVAGASSPSALAERIEPAGWSPVDASLRVSDPRRMVELFGGEQYYGEGALWVALRELLQNGIDAIEARRVLEPGFAGRILVEQEEESELEDKKGFWLHVSDDGIGMSERVLTRTLVDFGRSAKSSGELTREFKELKGKRVHTIGEFGIGFFSVLMLSEHVLVYSRPFDQGRGGTRKLRFSWGRQSRPLLMSPEPEKLPQSLSTKVSFFVKTERFKSLLESVAATGLGSLLARIAPLPNCKLDVRQRSQDLVTVRSPALYCREKAEWWLSSSIFYLPPEDAKKAAGRLDLIYDDRGAPIGWATLDFYKGHYAGLHVDRGLCQQDNRGDRLEFPYVIGVYPSSSTNPRRSEARVAKGPGVEAWLASQLNLLQPQDFSEAERGRLSECIYHFGGDPIEFAAICLSTPFDDEYGPAVWLALDDFLSLAPHELINRVGFRNIKDAQAKSCIEELLSRLMNDFHLLILNQFETLLGKVVIHPMLVRNIQSGQPAMEEFNNAEIDNDFPDPT